MARAAETALRPLERRERLVGALLQAGLDAETPAERRAVRDALCGLAPARVLTPAMLARGVRGVLDALDDLLVDYPRAVEYLAEMLTGVVEGTSTASAAQGASAAAAGRAGAVVPGWVLPDRLAAKLGVSNAAPAAAGEAPAAAAVAADAPPAPPADGAAPAEAVDDAELEGMFAKKKKKKGAKAAAE